MPGLDGSGEDGADRSHTALSARHGHHRRPTPLRARGRRLLGHAESGPERSLSSRPCRLSTRPARGPIGVVRAVVSGPTIAPPPPGTVGGDGRTSRRLRCPAPPGHASSRTSRSSIVKPIASISAKATRARRVMSVTSPPPPAAGRAGPRARGNRWLLAVVGLADHHPDVEGEAGWTPGGYDYPPPTNQIRHSRHPRVKAVAVATASHPPGPSEPYQASEPGRSTSPITSGTAYGGTHRRGVECGGEFSAVAPLVRQHR